MMEYLSLARVIHVLAVILWIGGVAMVTTVIIPAVKKMNSPKERMETFERIEGKFSLQAKITTLLTALSGFFMLYVMDAWERFLYVQFWWLHAMVLVWLIFTVILFVLEPLVLHKLYKKHAIKNPEKTFNFIHRAHWILLMVSLLTILGAVAGSHGWYLV
ncbi:hypothetical protein [Gramella sp. KN1008]|uniref:hypothetical protein n=1 Tax=Gramella sp. KN1008 TaxID=2529298 RepID=UPI001F602000|nr:hypothetical protein [Gramella sp. KN1008]